MMVTTRPPGFTGDQGVGVADLPEQVRHGVTLILGVLAPVPRVRLEFRRLDAAEFLDSISDGRLAFRHTPLSQMLR